MDQEQDTNRRPTSSPDGRMGGQTRSRAARRRNGAGDSEGLPTLFELPDLGGASARIDGAPPVEDATSHANLPPSTGSPQGASQAEFAAADLSDSTPSGRSNGGYAIHGSHNGPPPNHVDPPFGQAGLNRTGPRDPSVPPNHADPSVRFYQDGSSQSGHRRLPDQNSGYPQTPSDDQQIAATDKAPQAVTTGSSTDFSISRAAVIVLMLVVVTLSFIAGRSAHQMDNSQARQRVADVQNLSGQGSSDQGSSDTITPSVADQTPSQSVEIDLVVPLNSAPETAQTDLAEHSTTTPELSDAGLADPSLNKDDLLTTDELLSQFENLPDEAPSDFGGTESLATGDESSQPSYVAQSTPDLNSAQAETTADAVNSAAQRFNEMEFAFGTDFSDRSKPDDFASSQPPSKTAAEEISRDTISLGEPQINQPKNTIKDGSLEIPEPTENRPYSEVAEVQTSQVAIPEIPDDLKAPDEVVAYRAESPDLVVGADGIPAGMDNRLQLDEALNYSETPNPLGNLLELAESLGIWDASPDIVAP